ncbi:hypothetical protein NP233_g10945 [Leucocoprinus birnbaumii]|uniref:Uncharacterized protein n=1 Tax=Leucocoprinus birnbaumii TaxID=56174 RepID=A0AAD5VNC4_9AGAR|nr:hypothetical protein NP233_g10945 [Leucocoprinus birnbaumii]
MSTEYHSRPADPSEIFPGDTYVTTTTTERTYTTEQDEFEVDRDMSVPSSGDYPVNPATEYRYGANIGTGVYDPDAQNVASTQYTIRESDFERTAPDSGEGIHAHQYHGRDLGSIPIGRTTVIHEPFDAPREIDPEVEAQTSPTPRRLRR